MSKYIFSIFSTFTLLFLLLIIIIIMNYTNRIDPGFDNIINFDAYTHYFITTDEANLKNPEDYINNLYEESKSQKRYNENTDELIYIPKGLYAIKSYPSISFDYNIPLEISTNTYYSDRFIESLYTNRFYYNIPVVDGLLVTARDTYTPTSFLQYKKQNSYATTNITPETEGFYLVKPGEETDLSYFSELYKYDKEANSVESVSEYDLEKDLNVSFNKKTNTYTNNNTYPLIVFGGIL